MDEEAAKRVAVESARAMFMRPSEREAVSALERVINDAKLTGYRHAITQFERELRSAVDRCAANPDSAAPIDDVLAWLTRARVRDWDA